MTTDKDSADKLQPVVKGEFHVGEEKFKYPLLVKRYKSVLIDYLLLLFIMVITMVLIGEAETRSVIMISIAGILLLTYEPLLTVYSATIGQYLMGIRVRSIKNPSERINLFQAYIRVLVKSFLGWISFITINFNKEHRAIHDMAGSSVVITMK